MNSQVDSVLDRLPRSGKEENEHQSGHRSAKPTHELTLSQSLEEPSRVDPTSRGVSPSAAEVEDFVMATPPVRDLRRALRHLLLGLLIGIAPALAETPTNAPVAPAPPPDELLNARDPLPGLRTGGVPPSVEVFASLAKEGFVTFVDLRPEVELVEASRAGAESAGMTYLQIPIAGEADLDLGSARALDAVLADASRWPVVVACASGNRSGALLAVRAFWLQGKTNEEALALGKAAGLTKLEPSVRQLLGLPPLPPAPPSLPN
jgi:uncharacterized protein (TIGR01244 family)